MKKLGKAAALFMFLASITVAVTGCIDGDGSAKDTLTSEFGKEGGCFYNGQPCSNNQDW
jgi:hypothetical protein